MIGFLTELELQAKRDAEAARRFVLAVVLYMCASAVGNAEHADRPTGDAAIPINDPCVLTRTPEDVCRRFTWIKYENGTTDRIRIRLDPTLRAQADAYWQRPEHRWRLRN